MSAGERLGEMSPALWMGTLAVGLVILNILFTRVRRSALPPGPTPIPLLGSALSLLGRPLWVTFEDLRKQYGDIFCVRIGSRDIVVINGYDNIQKALVTEGRMFSGRPDITWTQITQKKGIFGSDGAVHQVQRAAVRQILTETNWDNSTHMYHRIEKQAKFLVRSLAETNTHPVDLQLLLDAAVFNVTSFPVIGMTFKHTDDMMKALSRISMEIFIDAGPQNINNYFPFLRYAPGDPTRYKALVNNATTAIGVVKGVINSHKERLQKDPGAERVDFIDYYLTRMAAKDADPSFSDDQLVQLVVDLLAMGIEATSCNIKWVFYFLCKYPEMQKRVQTEIDEVMMKNPPQYEQQQHMTFTRAFIMEARRCANVVSINLPHSPMEDVQFMGYDIPKGTIVIPNLASVHYDAKTFPDPHRFDPERHIKGGLYEEPERTMFYSAGSRMCPAKTLSGAEIFLFVTYVLQIFDIHMDGEVGEDAYGLIRYSGGFKVRAVPRQ